MSAPLLTAPTLVVGAGLAGLATALALAPRPVLLLTSAPPGWGAATGWAQGGIAAALAPDDSPDLHVADTLAAGAGLVDVAIASLVAQAAPAAIERLLAWGVPLDRDADGALALGREGGHGRRRIVHAQGDGSGAAVLRALVAAAWATPSITMLSDCSARALLVQDGRVVGVRADRAGAPFVVQSPAVVLATGGVGGLFRDTSNPLGACGDGLAIAARAGAAMADMEFVQFHPTALDVPRDPRPLVTEALRGEGAWLVDAQGNRLMLGVHPLAELAPRDVVTRAVWRHQAQGGQVFLDARAALGDQFAVRFPSVYAACMAAGIDPAIQPIPITPAAHYHMGGIAVDAQGRSTLPGLWAVGEVACTGLHGANRLASNSLLEALVFAPRVAADILDHSDAPALVPAAELAVAQADLHDQATLGRLRALMSRYVGVERDAEGLSSAIAMLRVAAEGPPSRVADAATVGLMIAVAALQRCESRGGHVRLDYPQTDPAQATHMRLTLADALVQAGSISSPPTALEAIA
jgi:L-aspartate oxidase